MTKKNIFRITILTFWLMLMCFAAKSQNIIQPTVSTRSADNDRSGDYQDVNITVASLKAKGITLRTTIPVIGDARGMEAQPLIVPNVKIADGTIHDIMVLPSMANVVRGVDAHTGVSIWQTPALCNPIQGSGAIDMHLINDKWGVLSTPVVNAGLAYMVPWCSADGTPQNGVHYMYTIRVSTGNIVGTPVSFAPLANGAVTYTQAMRKQRSSLVLITPSGGNPTVCGAYGTVLETGKYAAGAIFCFDTVLKKFTGFLPMSQGLGAGIWMGGQGLNADKQGNLYGVTGNGSFNGVNDFGESIFKVTYTPSKGLTSALAVSTWFSPYSDAGRVGLDPTLSGPAAPTVSMAKLSGFSAPSSTVSNDADESMPVGGAMKLPVSTITVLSQDATTGQVVPLVYPTNPTDTAWSDEDLGAGGCTLIESYGKMLCAGKDGLGYVVNTANMGNTMPADFANTPTAVCGKLASPPVWLTASPGPVDPCPQDTTTLNFMPYGKTRHMHMTPVQYMSPKDGLHVFVWGENSTLHDWKMSSTGQMTYVAESREYASVGSVNSPGGMPGGFCALSSNNFALGTAIIWCSIPLQNANTQITGGRLIAYDAENIEQDGDGPHLVKLWDSQDWGINYVFNKFMPPVIWDGEVILPNYNGGVMLFTQ